MRKILFPADAVIVAFFGLLSLLAFAFRERMDRPLFFIGLHAHVVATVLAVAWADRRFGGRFWRIVHHWFLALGIIFAFRELHYFIPEIQPFWDRRWDYALHALDARWFGDVSGFFRSLASRPVADVLSICYWMYFLMPVLVGIAVYRRGELRTFRQMATIFVFGFYLSYLGYVAVPAVGPHLVTEGPRAPELEGWLWAGGFHRMLLAIEWEMPDAFPSGHAMMTTVTLWLAWRHARRVFAWILPVGLGLIAATMYLRYHYIVDVLAGLALVPVAVVGGRWIARRWEPDLPPSGTDAASPGSRG